MMQMARPGLLRGGAGAWPPVWGMAMLALLLGIPRPAHADDPAPVAPPAAPTPPAKPAPPKPLTVEQAADAALAAAKSKDDEALKALAARDDPDPWLVADDLIRRGEFDAADAFARAAPRVDVEALPAYVASRRGRPDDPARRSRQAAAYAALQTRKAAEALDALGAEEPGQISDVVGVRLAIGRGIALASLVRLEASAGAWFAAGEASERLGWLARAARAFRESGLSAYRGSAPALARVAWEQELSIRERRGDRAGAATALGDIGGVHFSLGDYAKALSIQERALAAKEALGDRAGAAATLGNIGLVHSSLGDYAKALSTFERALAAKEALGDRAGAAATLVNLGNVHKSLGDYAKALEHLERGLKEAEAVGQREWASNALGGIGTVYKSLGDYAKALSIYERALAAQEALGNRAGAADTLCNIGVVHRLLGDYAKALSTMERALAAKEALGARAGAALVLGNIGVVYDSLGDHAKALSIYERALAAKEALGDRAGAAETLVNIGGVHFSLGDYAKALSTYERALAAEVALGDKAGAAKTLGNIGVAYHSLGDHAKALSTMGRALAAKEALGDKAGAAKTLGNIGGVYNSLGDYAKALATQERAFAAMEALGDMEGAAHSLMSTGNTYLSLGDDLSAIQFLDRAVRAAQMLRANDLHARALAGQAQAWLRSGDAPRAIADAHRAVLLLRTLVGRLGEEQGATAREQYTLLFSTGLAAAAKVGDIPEAAFFLESGRAGTLLESLGSRDMLRAALVPEELRVADVLARAREARALAAYTKAQDGGDRAATRARDEDLQAARAKVAEAVERIQRDAKRAARVIYPEAAPVAYLRGFLAAGEALVLYGLASKDDPAHALVLTTGEARIVALGKSSEVAAACEALDASDNAADPAAALGRLRDLLVKPLGLSKETRRLLVSPEGPLSYVPFSALVPDLDVVYEPSGTTYGVLLEEKGKRGEQVLALGDPDYKAKFDPTALDVYAPIAAAGAPSTRGGRLVPLPGTREEATAVGDVTRFGKDASEAGLRETLAKGKNRWRAVHFACHGLVNPDRPTLSSLALTPDAENDGFLTVLEVLRMEIASDLVVLSACETGKGKIVGGEGIVGLTRAFIYAGAPRVVCSLWKVDDEATKALMTEFYRLWNPKDGSKPLGTAAALRAAQEHIRLQPKWAHPYYWAAWVLWGLAE